MLAPLRDWLLQQGLSAPTAGALVLGAEIVLVVILASVTNLIAKRFVVRPLESFVGRIGPSWEQLIVRQRLLHKLSHLAPALVVYLFVPRVLDGYDLATVVAQRAVLIYMLLIAALAIDSVLNASIEIMRATARTRDLPVKSVVQVIKLVLYGVATIVTISLVIGRSPALLLSGLGAMTAVVMLVFRDSILGLVAGVQLSANRMLARGDWIEMPKYGADGDVVDVALTTVKVQNWDKTITTIPTYALITESFKNWRGMSESGGRRIKQAINIDIGSIRFCDDEMLERFSKIQHVAEYLQAKRDGKRQLTNVGTFRAYIEAYLRHHPMIHQDMTFLVRHLSPTVTGLPIEIYVFSRDQEWANYEAIQGDILDHIIAMAPAFDLRIYQQPSGGDVRDALTAVTSRRESGT